MKALFASLFAVSAAVAGLPAQAADLGNDGLTISRADEARIEVALLGKGTDVLADEEKKDEGEKKANDEEKKEEGEKKAD